MSECVFWSGQLNGSGYGVMWREGQRLMAHVALWQDATGRTVPEGMELDHLCGARTCVNPEHLEPVTHRENLLRSPRTLAGANVRKTHCPRGHAYAGQNLITTKRGSRACRACDNARKRVTR